MGKPLNICLKQEIDRLQKVISTVRFMLAQLKLAIAGTIVMSPELAEALEGARDRASGQLADADAALATGDGTGAAGSVSGVDGGNKFLPAQRHLERALAGFPPTTAPLASVSARMFRRSSSVAPR